MRDFKGRTVVITGAGSGIGHGAALAFAAVGANIVVSDVVADRVQATVTEVQNLNVKAVGVTCDISAADAPEKIRAQALAAFGRIDVLMNNVGVVISGVFEDVGVEHWRRAFDINLFAQIRTIQAMLPDISKRGEGHIINVASTTALYPYNVDRMPYNASKAAVLSVSESLAMYLRPRNIGVTCLCPGPVRTNIREQITVLTEGRPLAVPDLPILDPADVAAKILDAVRNGVFFLPTNTEVFDIVAQRGNGVDQFLEGAIVKLQKTGAI